MEGLRSLFSIQGQDVDWVRKSSLCHWPCTAETNDYTRWGGGNSANLFVILLISEAQNCVFQERMILLHRQSVRRRTKPCCFEVDNFFASTDSLNADRTRISVTSDIIIILILERKNDLPSPLLRCTFLFSETQPQCETTSRHKLTKNLNGSW